MSTHINGLGECVNPTEEDGKSVRQSQSVVLFVVDGLRSDGLKQANTPYMDSLMNSGAHTFEARTIMPSITLPCMASMLLGTGSELHGITTNAWTPIAPIPSIIDIVHSAGKTTASFYNWEPLRDLSKPGSLDAAFFRRSCSAPEGDLEIAEYAARYLLDKATAFALVYLGYTDIAGHDYGWMSDHYIEAIENADVAVGKVAGALNMASRFKNTFFIVTSDHGGHEKTHGTDLPQDMIVPWIISGPEVPAQLGITDTVNIRDTAPTIAALLAINRPDEWTGRVISEVVKPARKHET